MTRVSYNSQGLPPFVTAGETLHQFVAGVEAEPDMDYQEYTRLTDNLASPLSLALSSVILAHGRVIETPKYPDIPEYRRIDARYHGQRFSATSRRPEDQDIDYYYAELRHSFRKYPLGQKTVQILDIPEYDEQNSANASEKRTLWGQLQDFNFYKAGDANLRPNVIPEEFLDLRFNSWLGDDNKPTVGPSLRELVASREAGGPVALRNYLRIGKQLVSQLLEVTSD